MPRIAHKINTFNGGEYSSEFYGRTDLLKYSSGARRIENFIVHPEGGAHRRSGSRFVKAAIDSTKKSRLIPFVFSTEQAYMLEFSEFLIRVFANELQVGVAERSIDNPSTTTDEFTFADHGYVDDQGPFHITSTGGIPTGLAVDTDYWMSMPKTLTFTDAEVSIAANTITFTSDHEYVTEQGPFRVTTTQEMPATIAGNTDYYIEYVSDTAIKLRLTPAGASIALTILFGGDDLHTLAPTGDYLRDSFRLAATQGGAPIDITTTGTGPHVFTPNPDGSPTGLP